MLLDNKKVMAFIKTSSLIHKTTLVVVLLVVGILVSAQLFGQQGSGSLGSKQEASERNVMETSNPKGGEVASQTPIEGDLVEYVMKKYHNEIKGEIVLDPLVSPDNNQIVFVWFHTNEVVKGLVEGVESSNLAYEVLYLTRTESNPSVIAKNNSFFQNIEVSISPAVWIGNGEIILEAFAGVLGKHEGLVLFNLDSNKWQVLPMPKNYNGFKLVSNGTKIFYPFSSTGEYQKDEQGYTIEDALMIDSYGIYDLETKKTSVFKSIPPEIQQELEQQNNSSAKSSDPQGQDFSVMSNGCTLAGCPTFYLPWSCNKAMLVQRDGPQNCSGSCIGSNPNYDWNTEYSDCSLSVGSTYSSASGGCPSSCGHSRPAIDFGDAALWLQNGTPVLASANGEAQWKVDGSSAPNGGNYVTIRHPKSGGGYVYTFYMHLANNSIPSNIPNQSTGSWVPVNRGDKIGLEGNTDGTANGGAYHYHFELRSAQASGNSYYPIFMEYGGCTPKTGYTYISKNVPTDGSMQLGYDCSNVTNLTCSNSQTLTNQSTVNTASRFATYGNGYHNWDEYGPEKLYKITTTQTGTITVTLSNVVYSTGNDLDVFILCNPSSTSCSNLDPLLHTKGTSSGLTATYANAPAGTYYIVVDGYNGSSGSYTINVTAPCSSGTSLPNLTEYGSSYTSSGSTLTITAKPANYGSIAAGAFSIGYWLSPDNIFGNGNDIGLAALNYSGLSANSYNIFTFSVNTSGIAPIGNYYILFKIDYLNQVTESNETDNVWMFNQQYYLPTSAYSKTSSILTPIKHIVANGIDELVDSEEWTDRYEETQLVSDNEQAQDLWLWKDTYGRWVVSVSSGDIITITDITGKVIKTIESREDGELWLPKLPSGLYVVSVCCDEMKKEKVGKIMY